MKWRMGVHVHIHMTLAIFCETLHSHVNKILNSNDYLFRLYVPNDCNYIIIVTGGVHPIKPQFAIVPFSEVFSMSCQIVLFLNEFIKLCVFFQSSLKKKEQQC